MREIATALANRTNLIVAAPRRTGKTSVCDAALGRLRRSRFYTVRIDLFRIADAAELSEALALAVIANRSALHRVVRRAREVGRAALNATQAAAVLKLRSQLGDAVELAITPGWAAQNPERALDLALELPERVARADGRRAIVFFDEFQEVASDRHLYGDPDAVTKRMRAIFQRSAGVTYLFAGSIEHLMHDLFTPAQRALHGFGGFHRLRPIEPEAWLEGLGERFAADDCEADGAALRRLIDYGEGHARSTMLIAQKAHVTTIELDTRRVDLAIVEQGLLAAMAGDRIAHEQTVERIRRLHKLGLVVAERIARDQPVYPGLPRGAVRRALEALRDAALIEAHGRGDWQFNNPLLRRYLRDISPYPAAE